MEKDKALAIQLFNGLEIHTEPQDSLKFASLRAEILIAWLAMHPGQHRREMIASLLWDERDQTRALGNLRTLLARLPKPVKSFLLITPQTLGSDPEQRIDVDLLEFDRLVSDSNYAEAEMFFTGEPLAGVHIAESEGLYEWMMMLREEYRQKGINLLQTLAELAHTQGEFGQGILYAQKLVQLDPLREESYRLLMRLLARDGRRGEALNVFTKCRQMLRDEFDLEPQPETVALAERLQSGLRPQHNLPVQPTPFIGRIPELAKLRELLAFMENRLISIVGAGGMGKTRLAIECGQQLEPQFLDGVAFVSLVGVERPELVDVTIGATLVKNGFIPPNTSNLSPMEYLCQHLKKKEMLLILDNYEHLIESAPLLSELLDKSIGLKLMVTSRTRLGLRWERLIELHGLQFSADVLDDNWLASDAVRLFLQTTQHVIPDFSMAADDRLALTEICSLVGSMPLALELAARWARLYSCREILGEIENNIEFLVSTDRDVPERHRSILAVFDYSWKQLAADERDSLAKMAVFRGQFDLPAARQVTGASQSVVANLIDHSLLNRIDDGRQGQLHFELHSLLRDFALRKLARSADILEAVRRRHIQYYLQLLIDSADALAEDKKRLNRRIKANLDNIRAAWDRAIQQEMWPLLVAASKPLSLFWQREGLNQEGADSLGRALLGAAGKVSTVDLLSLKLERIRCLRSLIRYEEAIAEIETALQLIDDKDRNSPILAEICLVWGEILSFQSDLDAAEEKLSLALTLATHLEEKHLIGEGFRLLGLLAYYQGDMQKANERFENAYRQFQTCGDLRGIADTQNNFGMVHSLVGENEEALFWQKSAIDTWEKMGDIQRSLIGKTNVGYVLVMMGQFREGLDYLEQGRAGFQEIGHIVGEGHALKNHGLAYTRLGRYETAENYLNQSLHLFHQAGTKNDEVFARFFLAALYRNWGKRKAAHLHVKAARTLAHEFENQEMLIMAHIYLGYLALDAGDGPRARSSFESALAIQKQLDKEHWMHESRAGMAAGALLAGKPLVAEELLLPHVDKLTPEALMSTLQPFSVILTYVEVLQAQNPELAKPVLGMGLEMLAAWEEEAPDERSRETFRTAVPAHRALLEYGGRSETGA